MTEQTRPPLVSVIVATYNRSAYIEQTLDSGEGMMNGNRH